MTHPPLDDELSPPLITISLSYYLSLACRGFPDQQATINTPLAHAIQQADPTETIAHVEYINSNLAQVYTIGEWRECLRRREQLKKASEEERQRRYIIEESIELNRAQVQRRRDILHETLVDVLKLMPIRDKSLTEELLEWFCYQALMGMNAAAATKFRITNELIAEFKSLPFDDQWKNRYKI